MTEQMPFVDLSPEGMADAQRQFREMMAAAGVELEITLPAGATIHIAGAEARLQAPVVVRMPGARTVVEGRTEPGTPAHEAWPERYAGRFLPVLPASERRVSMMDIDHDHVIAVFNLDSDGRA